MQLDPNTKYSKLIRVLDKKLSDLNKHYINKELVEGEELNGICLSLGFLIGKILYTETGQRYYICYGKNAFDGQEVLMSKNGDHELYISDWVYEAIANGDKHKVSIKIKHAIKSI